MSDKVDSSTPRRLVKREARNLPGVLDRLLALRPVSFRYGFEDQAEPPADARVELGFFEDEVALVLPEAIVDAPAEPARDAADSTEPAAQLEVDPTRFAALAVAAVIELNAKLAALESRIAALEVTDGGA